MIDQAVLNAMLDTLCPMHISVGRTGHILHCGPTLSKLSKTELVGQRMLEVFQLQRPKNVATVSDLFAHSGQPVRMLSRDKLLTSFKGVVFLVTEDLVVFNLSFGIGVVDAVRDYKLTNSDFAHTDLTIEMLYLVEAKSAAMDASKKLNQRLQGAKIAAEEQAFTDTLTGLKNRRALDHVLNRYEKWGSQFALMHVDLDWFKEVNDTLGHAAGDHVLQVFAAMLVEEMREGDTIARVGGDEFTLLLPDVHDEKHLAKVGNRIVARLADPIMFGDDPCGVSASIGTAIYEPGSGVGVGQVAERADTALYASKRNGRAQQTIYTPELSMAELTAAPDPGSRRQRM